MLIAELAVAVAGFSSIVVAVVGSSILAEVTYLYVLVWHLGVAAMGFAFLTFCDRSDSA